MSKGNNLNKNWYTQLLSVNKLPFEEERKRLFFLVANVIATIVLLAFAVIHYLAGEYTHCVVNIVVVFISVISVLLCRKQRDGKKYYRFVTLLGIFICLYTATQDTGYNYQTLWFFTIPGIVFFMLGKKEGLIASLALLIGFVLILVFSHETNAATRFIPAFHLRLFAIFIVLMLINWSSESMRSRDQRLLNNRNKALKTDRLRIAQTELKMRELAHNDELTGIANRRAILNILDIKLSNTDPEKTLAVGLLDIDHFKKVNDNYGHQIGDQVLIELATRIKNMIRKNDMFGRYGGEEFLILLDNPGNENIENVFEKIRQIICDTPVETDIGPIEVTGSIGIAVMQDSGDPTQLIRDADKALYQAKESGRNRIVLVDS